MPLSKHDELLLRDLKFQPIWLLFFYILVGIAVFVVGLKIDSPISKWLCGGGGFVVALGAEKLVTRRIRYAAKRLLDQEKITN